MDVLPALLLLAFMAGIIFACVLKACLATCLGPRPGTRKTNLPTMSRKLSQLGEDGSLSTSIASQSLRDGPDVGQIFLNPSANIFHVKGCFHIGPNAKAIRACKHCMPAVKSNKGD